MLREEELWAGSPGSRDQTMSIESWQTVSFGLPSNVAVSVWEAGGDGGGWVGAKIRFQTLRWMQSAASTAGRSLVFFSGIVESREACT